MLDMSCSLRISAQANCCFPKISIRKSILLMLVAEVTLGLGQSGLLAFLGC